MRLLNKKGQGMIEYTLILAAVVVLAVVLIRAFKEPAKKQIDVIEQEMKTLK